MKIFLVRHGETDWNKDKILMGQADIPLNENGIKQAKNIAEKLSNIEFDVCFTSPLSRAKETAEIICHGKTKIIEDALLMERGCGRFSGKNKGEFNWDEYNNDTSVETNESLFKRAQEFIDELYRLNAQNVLVVSHSGLLKNLYHISKGENFTTFDWNSYKDEFKDNGNIKILDIPQNS